MKILSIFDGISCARVALERAGIPVELYYASEVDKYAMQISKKNWFDIVQLPRISFKNEKTRIIHNSFIDKAKIENSINNTNYCLRCGIDRNFIKREKISCMVWGRNYKRHFYK